METSFNDGFKIPFREYILDDAQLSSLIGNRFYGAWLATFYNDATTFPLATFSPIVGNFHNLGIIQRFTLGINSYSNQHYDEAWEIDKAILDICGGFNGPISITPNITIRPFTTGQESYDEIARLYSISRRYGVVWIPSNDS